MASLRALRKKAIAACRANHKAVLQRARAAARIQKAQLRKDKKVLIAYFRERQRRGLPEIWITVPGYSVNVGSWLLLPVRKPKKGK